MHNAAGPFCSRCFFCPAISFFARYTLSYAPVDNPPDTYAQVSLYFPSTCLLVTHPSQQVSSCAPRLVLTAFEVLSASTPDVLLEEILLHKWTEGTRNMFPSQADGTKSLQHNHVDGTLMRAHAVLRRSTRRVEICVGSAEVVEHSAA